MGLGSGLASYEPETWVGLGSRVRVGARLRVKDWAQN